MKYLAFLLIPLIAISCNNLYEVEVTAQIRHICDLPGLGIREFEKHASDTMKARPAFKNISFTQKREVKKLRKLLSRKNYKRLTKNWYETGYPGPYRKAMERNSFEDSREAQISWVKSYLLRPKIRITLKSKLRQHNDTLYIGKGSVNGYFLGETDSLTASKYWIARKEMKDYMYMNLNGSYYLYKDDQLTLFYDLICPECEECTHYCPWSGVPDSTDDDWGFE
ncbi:MAG: hypothetical protein AAGI38_15200 [Bacteroidota bacterium]